MIKIYPSLISANLLHLAHSIETLAPHCHGWHIDIMDNHFVDNLTWGAQFANAIAAYSDKQIWVHVMIDNPTSFLEKLSLPADSIVTFHIETKDNISSLITSIKNNNWQPSIALNPKTDATHIFPFLDQLHHVLIMSVNPGHSGQRFLPEVLPKIKIITDECYRRNLEVTLAIDGGINKDNIAQVAQLGVQDIGIASGIFSQPDPVAACTYLYEQVNKA